MSVRNLTTRSEEETGMSFYLILCYSFAANSTEMAPTSPPHCMHYAIPSSVYTQSAEKKLLITTGFCSLYAAAKVPFFFFIFTAVDGLTNVIDHSGPDPIRFHDHVPFD